MNKTLNKIADTCSIIMVKAQCFDLHDDKKEVLKDMAEQIDSIYENFAILLKEFKDASNED